MYNAEFKKKKVESLYAFENQMSFYLLMKILFLIVRDTISLSKNDVNVHFSNHSLLQKTKNTFSIVIIKTKI